MTHFVMFDIRQRYEEWKDGLPDMGWMKEILPSEQQLGTMSKNLMSIRNTFKDSIELGI